MRIDCNISENYLNEFRRMCNWAGDCPRCDAVDLCNSTDPKPAAMIAVTQKWSDEHPIKTYLDDLLEKYPDIMLGEGEVPYEICPHYLGWVKYESCNCTVAECTRCWNRTIY